MMCSDADEPKAPASLTTAPPTDPGTVAAHSNPLHPCLARDRARAPILTPAATRATAVSPSASRSTLASADVRPGPLYRHQKSEG